MYKELPKTGMIGLGIFGISTQNSIVIGLSLIVLGYLLYRIVRFKIKDK